MQHQTVSNLLDSARIDLPECNLIRCKRRCRLKRSLEWRKKEQTEVNYCQVASCESRQLQDNNDKNALDILADCSPTNDLKSARDKMTATSIENNHQKVIKAQIKSRQSLACLSMMSRAQIVALCYWLILISLISCQTNPSDLFPAPEARGEFFNRLQPRGQPPPSNNNNNAQPNNEIDLNQLVNLFNTLRNQQRANGNAGSGSSNNNNNVQPLPLGAMGGQRGGGLAAQIMPSSTPVNPFVAAVNFQPTRRQQQQQHQSPSGVFGSGNRPSANANTNAMNDPGLQLNRLNSNFNGATNIRGQQISAMGPILGAGQQRPALAHSQFARPNSNQRTPLVPPPLGQNRQQQQQAVRPITGFAPSGPPPSSAANSAISVVQSPANAIGSLAQSATNNVESSVRAGSGANTTPGTPPGGAPQTSSTPNEPNTTTTTSSPIVSSGVNSGSGSAEQQSSSQRPSASAETTTTAATTTTTTTTTTTATSVRNGAAGDTSTGQDVSSGQQAASNWNPVQQQAAKDDAAPLPSNKSHISSTLAPTPDIVTVPPGYDPNQAPAQTYDISVSAQMGGSPAKKHTSAPHQAVSSSPVVSSAAAPIEVTTIFWSPPSATLAPADTAVSPSSKLARDMIQPTRVTAAAEQSTNTQLVAQSPPPVQSSVPLSPGNNSAPAAETQQPPSVQAVPTRIRDSGDVRQSDDNSSSSSPSATTSGSGVVYGKPQADAKPTGPPSGSHESGLAAAGRPFIQAAPLDSQVRPFSSGARHHTNGASSARPMAGPPGLVGSAFTIVAQGNQSMPTGDIQDYVAGQPPPFASGNGQQQQQQQQQSDPFELAPIDSNQVASGQQQQQQHDSANLGAQASSAPKVRRPTFKPKPAVPPIRIDSCIVGDDSSCDQSHNERCVTEYGISSCHCRPGYARLSQLRGYCSPVVALQFSMKIDKLSDDRRLSFNHTLENPNSEEYQYLEFETLQAVASGMQQTMLSKLFMGARVNKFLERKGRVWANVSVQLEFNNVTKSEPSIQKLMAHELTKLQRQRQPLGDSTIVLDAAFRDSATASPSVAFSKLQDVNECASKDLNDCSKHATCTNEFGSFSCQCLSGFEDRYLVQWNADQSATNSTTTSAQLDKNKLGRTCMGCSPAYCSNRGECMIVEGKKQCKCRANFMGSRCDIDSEVLAVAVGGSLIGLLILVVTFWCLFVFNRRWRREQQKMDAMSATSGLTNYNYASNNSANSTNSLVSPVVAAQQSARSIGGRSSAAAATANYVGQRFVGGLMGRATSGTTYHMAHPGHHHHNHMQQYALEQQAMLAGSGTSSASSSATSQPLACNPYQGNPYAPYDDGLLIAPASTGSSEQTSPTGNSYRGIIAPNNTNHSAAMMAAGNAYTLSGHHHNHHQLYHQMQHLNHHHQQNTKQQTFSQFHPMDPAHQQYARTLANKQQTNGYDSRWRTLQSQQDQIGAKINGNLAGYYLVR